MHYALVNKRATDFYVYTVAAPELKEDNYIAFKQSIHPNIVCRTEEKLKIVILEKQEQDGKEFRKFLARQLTVKADFLGERAAAIFLNSIVCSLYCLALQLEKSGSWN